MGLIVSTAVVITIAADTISPIGSNLVPQELFFQTPIWRSADHEHATFQVRETMILRTVACKTMLSEGGGIQKPLFSKTVLCGSIIFKYGTNCVQCLLGAFVPMGPLWGPYGTLWD